MAKRFPLVVPYMDLVKNLLSTTPKAAITSNYKLIFSKANHTHVHTKGGDPLVGGATNEGAGKATEVIESVGEAAKESVDTAKKTAQLVTLTDTTTAEADMNVVDTVEYRCAEDLTGQLGDGCDKI